MNCRDVIDFLTEYLEGRCTLRQRLVLRLHLLLCRHCRAYLRNFRATIQAERKAHHCSNEIAECPPIPEELVRAILAARGPASSRPGDEIAPK